MGKTTLFVTITHPLSVANANASLLLNRAIDNFQWGPPSGQNVGPNKAPSFKAKGTIWFFDEFILFTKKTWHKELGQTTGFANAYGQKITAYPMVRVCSGHMKCKNPAKYLQPASVFLLHKPKDYDGLCQHSESLWVSRPPAHNWLTSMWTHAWDDDPSIQSMPLVWRMCGLSPSLHLSV